VENGENSHPESESDRDMTGSIGTVPTLHNRRDWALKGYLVGIAANLRNWLEKRDRVVSILAGGECVPDR